MTQLTHKHTKLIRDLQNKLHELYGANNAPVFTDIKLLRGHWQVWLLGFGWVCTTDLLDPVKKWVTVNDPEIRVSHRP